MATRTVWTFDSPDGAVQALNTLWRVDDEGMRELVHAAVMSLSPGAMKRTFEVLHQTRR